MRRGPDGIGGNVGVAESIAASTISLLRDLYRADIAMEFD
jgi:hypothetical protein